jgi:hypothetical protein
MAIRLDFLATTLDVSELQGVTAPAALVSMKRGKAVMDGLRASPDASNDEERRTGLLPSQFNRLNYRMPPRALCVPEKLHLEN